MSKSKARKLAEFLRNLTDDAKINTSAVQQDNVVTSRLDLESKANDTEALVTAASVTSYVSSELGEYVHSTHDIPLTFTGDVTGSGVITDMGATSFNLTLDAETLPSQIGHSGKFLTTNGTAASWASLNITNWNTAYGWGNHATQGYLTSYTETDTLQSVTTRGSTTDRTLYVNNSLALQDTNTDARIHLGNSSGGASGVIAGKRLTDGGNLRYGTYYAYDCYWSDTDLKWYANRGSLTRKTVIEQGYHINEAFRFRYYGNDASQGWADSDWSNVMTISRTGTVTANRFVGSIDYSNISNPPVIDNSVDYVNAASFNTTTGVLTLSGVGRAGAVVDLDGRYLTSYTDTNTTYAINAQDVSGGKAIRLTGSDGSTDDVTFAAGSNVTLTRSGDTITIASTDTNTDTNTTDWYVANSAGTNQFKVDKNEKVRFEGSGATSVSFDAATNKVTINSTDTNTETTTTLTKVGNELRYVNEAGTTQTIDLSLYLDDTNLARILSGTMNSSGIATFTRDDGTSFTVDMSVLLDDTNLSRIVSASWNTSNGVLTLTRNDSTTVSVDLDNRYLTSYTETDTLQSVTNRGRTTTNNIRFTQDEGGIEWERNTDRASIKFYNDSDGDTNSRLEFNIADNTNEDFRFTYTTGTTITELLRMRPDGGNNGITFRGHTMWHAGNFNPSNYLLTSNYEDNYVDSVAFNTSTGVLTIGRTGSLSDLTVDLDNRYSIESHNHDDRYTQIQATFRSGAQNFDNLKTSGFHSLYNANASGSVNAPFQYGAMISAGNTSANGGMAMQLAHERLGNGTYIRGMNDTNDTWYPWQRMFTDLYHPNADKWTNTRTNTVTLTGDVTGSGSASVDGSGNWTVSVAADLTVASTDTFTGTYPIAWLASDNLYKSTWLTINGATDTLNTRNINANGTVTANNFVGSIDYSNITNPPAIDNSVDYINSASFNTSTGVLTLSGVGRAGATVDLDNRYLTSYTETDTLQSVTTRGNTTNTDINIVRNVSGAKVLVESTTASGQAGVDFKNPALHSRLILDNDDLLRVYNQTSAFDGMALKSDGSLVVKGGQPLTRGGRARLSIFGGPLSIGDSDNDMSYIRKQGTAQFCWQTNNGNNSGNIQLQPYGGNVIIGSTSGVGKLHVHTGSGTGDANTVFVDRAGTSNYSGISFATAGSVDWSIGQNSVGGFSIYENGLASTTRLTVKDGGNIGMGTTNPGAPLHVYRSVGYTASTDLLRLEGYTPDFGTTPASVNLLFKFQDSNNATNEARIKMAAVNDTDYGDNDEAASNLIFETTNGGVASDKMIITGRGSIGMGGLNPQSNLSVLTDINYDPPTLGTHGSNFSILKKDGTQDGAYGLLVGVTGSGDGWIQAQRTSGAATAYKLRLQPSGGNVTIGGSINDDTRSSYYWLPDPEGTGTYSSHRFGTNHGYIDIGPKNTTYAHMDTDRAKFYFNKRVLVDEGIISSFNEDLYLRRAESSSHQIRIAAGTTTISQNTIIEGNLTVNGSIAQADGFGTLYTFNTTQGLSTSWADVTAIAGNALPTGTYAIQIFINNSDVGGNSYSEYYSGTMSWYGAATNDGDWNEIPLHNAGHAQNGPLVYARTLRRSNSTMILQLAASGTVGSDGIQIKLRRLI